MFRIADVSAGPILRVYGEHGFANREHPIVRRIAALSGHAREDYTPLDEFLSTLLWNWPLVRSVPEEADQSEWLARSRLKLGYLYSAIDWEAVPPAFRPPYTAFVPGDGVEVLSGDQLSAWAQNTKHSP
jgi:hypothetical protein